MALREVLAFFGVDFDSKELDKGNESIGNAIKSLQALAGVVAGSALVVGIQNLVGEVRQQTLALSELSGQVNISTDDLQQWQFVGQSLLVSNQDTSQSFVELAKRIGDAATKGGDAAKVFGDLGVELKNGEQIRSTAEVFDELRASFAGLASEAEQVSKAEALFGGAGRKILPLLKATDEQVGELRREFEELGGGIEFDTIKSFQEMERTNAKLDFAMMSLKSNVAGGVLPVFQFLAEGATKVSTALSDITEDGDKTSMVLAGIGTAAIIAGVMFGGAFLTAVNALGPVILGAAALYVVTEDLIQAYQGGRSTIAVFWKEWTGGNIAEDLRDAVNWADRFFTALKGIARIAGVLGQALWKSPQTIRAFVNTGDYKAASEKLQELLKTQREIQNGATRADFVGIEKKKFADNPELLEAKIQEQQKVVAQRKREFDEAERGVADFDVVDKFSDVFDAIERDADAMNERIQKRTADGKMVGAKVDENIANYEHRKDEEGAGMSLPRFGDLEREKAYREQQLAEADLAGGLIDFRGLDFKPITESTDALTDTNASLAQSSEDLMSSYAEASHRTEQLASMTRENTTAVGRLAEALRSAEAQGLSVDNINIFMQPGQGAREAGERTADEFKMSLRSAMASR